MEYLAHIAEDGRVQTVSEHLSGTGALAAEFGAAFGASNEARYAGTLHDIGKYSAAFQHRLRGARRSTTPPQGQRRLLPGAIWPPRLPLPGITAEYPIAAIATTSPMTQLFEGA